MEINLTSNAKEYRAALVDFIGAFHVSVRQALKYQGRLMGEKLITLTPPRTQKQGERRVSADIKRIILGVEDLPPLDQAHLVEKGENVVRVFVSKDGTVYGTDRNLYRPEATMDEISKYHQSQRTKNGRVTSAGTRTRDVGRWKFIEKLVITRDKLDEYIGMVKDRVGRGKGGWATGVIKEGGKVSSWIGRHARTAGTYLDATNDAEPYVLFINKSEWASGGDHERIIENAVQSRTRDIHSYIRRKIKEGSKPIFK
ncbi:MAG: hypothetical protein JWR19_2163 [Pedosphaera sp.]|nr:hypothetical protein [Pedosphaera sp.]